MPLLVDGYCQKGCHHKESWIDDLGTHHDLVWLWQWRTQPDGQRLVRVDEGVNLL